MKKLLVLAALLTVVAGCSEPEQEAADPASDGNERPLVYATNYPLRYFVERVGGAVVEVRLPVPAGEDPAYWRPDTEDVLALQRADLIVLNGASYESWLENVSLPPSRMVVTTDGLGDRLIPLEEETTHSHGLEGEHQHSGTAFTTWLDPTLAVGQARAIKNALAARWPAHSALFEAQLEALTRELEELDRRAQELAAGNPRLPLLFSHPVYQYLESRYRLNARSVHWEPDRIPDAVQWQELRAILQEFPASWMLWEDTPLRETSERLESLGIRSVVVDPCADNPGSGDFLTTMEKNLQSMRLVFAAGHPPAEREPGS